VQKWNNAKAVQMRKIKNAKLTLKAMDVSILQQTISQPDSE